MSEIDQGGLAGSPASPDGADLTAAKVDIVPPEIVTNSLQQYLRAWWAKVRSGDTGVLPVIIALVAVTVSSSKGPTTTKLVTGLP